MDRPLRAGIALYNAGFHHAAHDAWEPVWLDCPEGDDERLLHGLIQYTAAIHHARTRNWAGATGLAESARGYLAGLPDDYRGVDLVSVRRALAALGDDPEWIERARPPRLVHRGNVVSLPDLDSEECLLVAPILASAGGYDASLVERAREYASEALEAGESSPFLALCVDFVREPTHRDLVYGRLADRVSRRRSRERDVEGLFDPGR
ncbi:DUF309 domain-containing protein [Halalkalicoccus sp. NIPERK01]|uniref:DUF309 domain-containing protein n=1 Tax=Halalkalicoccus sp. NIPERK01 TaxID=3053469 RepID=UPI00256EB8BB|nr:DUF309 domain-containing protein [Halalkalicoccus sp. NIPERK01]MDL5362047.1 DUF309 domain-containing protein [Halalkalicoccus sp. NIPERK01]